MIKTCWDRAHTLRSPSPDHSYRISERDHSPSLRWRAEWFGWCGSAPAAAAAAVTSSHSRQQSDLMSPVSSTRTDSDAAHRPGAAEQLASWLQPTLAVSRSSCVQVCRSLRHVQYRCERFSHVLNDATRHTDCSTKQNQCPQIRSVSRA